MAGFDNKVQVNVTIGSPSVGVDGFGVPLWASEDLLAGFVETNRVYTSPEDVTNDVDLDAATKLALSNAFSQPRRVERIVVGNVTLLTLAADLDAIRLDNDDWYFLGVQSIADADNLAASAWAELNGKVFMGETLDPDVIGAGVGISADIAALGRKRTAILWHSPPAADYPTLSWAAFKLEADPDVRTTTWAWSPLVNITPDKLTGAEVANAEAEVANLFTSSGTGRNVAGMGRLVDNTPLDLLLTLDWTTIRMKQRAVDRLIEASERNEKIPYTNEGLDVFGDVVRQLIDQGVEAGHFVVGTATVNVPKRSEADPTDIANRIARIEFDVEVAGAIEGLRYSGFLIVAT